MRAMILAAGLGTRLRPLTELRAKPALPVRGRPVISLLLGFLARHGVEDVLINLHYLPRSIREAVERDRPEGLRVRWSYEEQPLGTGGGVLRAAAFLSGAPQSVVLAGDMLLDTDLTGLVDRHIASGRDASLVLLDDARGDGFGTLGVDAGGLLTRIGEQGVAGGDERAAGLFTGIRVFSASALAHLPDRDRPDREVFEDLRDWLAPAQRSGDLAVGGLFADPDRTTWEPVGTPSEYLDANLDPPRLSSFGPGASDWEGEGQLVEGLDRVWLDRGARIEAGARLRDAVVWAGETVPADCEGTGGVFADGRFHACRPSDAGAETRPAEAASNDLASAQGVRA